MRLLGPVALVVPCVLLVGCGQPPSVTPSGPPTITPTAAPTRTVVPTSDALKFGRPALSDRVCGNADPVAADVNGDGRPDVLAADAVSGGLPFITQKDGRLARPIAFGSDVGAVLSIAAADFDRDGRMDVVVGTNDGVIAVLLGDGAGGFRLRDSVDLRRVIAPKGTFRASVAVGDLNGDGFVDVVAFGLDFQQQSDNDDLAVLLGRGDGTLELLRTSGVGLGVGSHEVAIADFDRDGRPDLFLTALGDLYYGQGDGSFGPPTSLLGVNGSLAAAVTHLDGDGRLDIAALTWNSPSTVKMFSNRPDDTFSPLAPVTLPFQGDILKATDMDGDGLTDLVITHHYPSPLLSVLRGIGGGRFESPVDFEGLVAGRLLVVDLNADGRPDIVGVNENRTLWTMLNETR